MGGGNTAIVNGFDFGGGSAIGPAATVGNAAGSLGTSITLVSDGVALTNELFQEFTPGAVLSFLITLTTNVALPTPDAFAFSILDGNLFNIPTNGPGDPLLLVNIDGSFVQTHKAAGFHGGRICRWNATAVPEPSALLLLGSARSARWPGRGGVRRALAGISPPSLDRHWRVSDYESKYAVRSVE